MRCEEVNVRAGLREDVFEVGVTGGHVVCDCSLIRYQEDSEAKHCDGGDGEEESADFRGSALLSV